jgi:hypothetical protein
MSARAERYIAWALASKPVSFRGKSGLACGRKARRAGLDSGSTDACNPRDPRAVIPGEFPPVFGQPIIDPSSMFDVAVIEGQHIYDLKGQGGVQKSHTMLVDAMVERFRQTGIRPAFMPLQKFSKHGYWVRKPGALYVDTTGNEKVVGPAKDEKGRPIARAGVADVTYASISRSCPMTCALKDAGCYAQSGKVSMTVSRLDREAKAFDLSAVDVAQAEAFGIVNSHLDIQGNPTEIADHRVLRLHVSGDAATAQAAAILNDAVALWYARSRGGKARTGYYPDDTSPKRPLRAWSYTHAWSTVPRAAWHSVSVLGSIDKISEGAAALRHGYAPAVVVDTFNGDSAPITDNGIKYIKCPAQTKERYSCVECRLCFSAPWLYKNKLGIAFEAHGAGAGKVRRRLRVVD